MSALRRLAIVGVVSLCVLVGGLVFGSVGALATFTYPFDGQLAPAGGSFGHLGVGSVAVDDSNGKTYVADSGAVDVFETATGAQLAGLDGSLTPAGSFGGNVAVAANNGTGEVYVLDPAHGVVDAFSSAGAYVCQITGASTPSASECNGVTGSDTPAHGFNSPGGIAVDQATGDVYVVDAYNGAVDIFSGGGEYLRQIALSSVPGGFSPSYTRGIAVDDFNGHVYVSDSGSLVVYEFDAAGGYVATWTGANTPAESFGGGYLSVAADDTTGDVYVTETTHKVTDVFASSGAYLRQFAHSFNEPLGTAVDQGSGGVYVSDDAPGVVDIFDPATVLPTVTTGSSSGVLPTSATVQGSVNPEGVQLSDCRFDYGTSTAYGQSVPCVPDAASTPADSNTHAVSADLTGLAPGSTYHFRLEASNANCAHCTSFGEDATFSTPPPPSIDSESAKNVTSSSADLSAKIDPNGYDTTYRFEWGTSTGYGTSVPVPDGDVGAGTGGVPVTVHLSGLSADTTYHWRVVAQNASGTTTTGDHTFIYSTAGATLPDGRAYEMVTPVQKNGALIGFVVADTEIPVDVAEDGSRLVMPGGGCFAGAESCVALRGKLGAAVYEFGRGSAGWATSSLSLAGGVPESEEVVSADTGMELLTLPTAPGGGSGWYARGNDGSLVEIGPAGPPSVGQSEPPELDTLAGLVATPDLSHVVWTTEQSAYRWPFDLTTPYAPGSVGVGWPSAYEYVGRGGSAPVMVGVTGGAGSTDLVSICGTAIPESRPGVMSADGRTVFFTAQACSTGSGANAGVAVPGPQLWARIDQSRSVRISERSPSDCSGGCTSSPEAGLPEFMGASADGSRAFFTSVQQLTNDASQDTRPKDGSCYNTVGVNGCNLYMYDFSRPAGQSLVDLSAGDSSGGGPRVRGVMAISPDGSHVYFVAQGVLTQAANDRGESARSGANNLYVYERDATYPEGHMAFIASLPRVDFEEWTPALSEDFANVTPDGRFLVFRSSGDLTLDDTSLSGARQLFRYDAQTAQLVRISVGDLGFDDNGNRPAATPCAVAAGGCAEDVHIRTDWIGGIVDPRLDPTMSHDGAYVFFTSSVALAPGALDDVQVGVTSEGVPTYAQNVYEWHAGRVYLISDGKDISQHSLSSPVQLLGSDATGANVFFSTADPLVAQDTDTQVDVYDARICTAGEPCVQPPVPAEPCQGEACHTPPSPAPGLAGVASSTLTGAGNLAPAPAAPGPKKAVVKKKKKHVKRGKRKHKKTKRSRKASARRAGGKPAVRS